MEEAHGPLSRPSASTQTAPASRSPAISSAHPAGDTGTSGSFEPTSDTTRNLAEASEINRRFCDNGMPIAPFETSTHGEPRVGRPREARVGSALPHATSSNVPPRRLARRGGRGRETFSGTSGSR